MYMSVVVHTVDSRETVLWKDNSVYNNAKNSTPMPKLGIVHYSELLIQESMNWPLPMITSGTVAYTYKKLTKNVNVFWMGYIREKLGLTERMS